MILTLLEHLKLRCCCKLNCSPSLGFHCFKLKALLMMLGSVLLKKFLRSSEVRSLSRKLRNPTKISGSLTSSSGSRLMLEKDELKRKFMELVLGYYLQSSWIFCIPSMSSMVFLVFWIALRCFWTWCHHGRSQGSITNAIF